MTDAGGARPASDVVNHCVDCCCARSWSALGVTEYDGKSIPEHITRLRDSEALVRGKIVEQMIESDVRVLERAERAEAEVARLTKQASAVVVIMPPREPTQEMDDAASNVDRSNLPGIFRRQVWRAMWDASGVAKDSVITGNEP